MDPISTTMLLSSIDHTLASVRAALAAGADAEQTGEARRTLAGGAGADIARLLVSSRNPGWRGIPPVVARALEEAGKAAEAGDLAGAEEALIRARGQLGGPSR